MSTLHNYRRIPYVIIGEAAIISIKNIEDVKKADILEAAKEIARRHPRLKAVYAKIETEGVYRIPRLVLIAGEPIERTWHKENGLYFRVTLGKTYFNPKLATEHLYIAKLAEDLEARKVADLFSGVGGYALTIAAYSKSTKIVLANDLNPYSIADLHASLYRNKRRIKDKTIITFCEDAKKLPEILNTIRFDFLILDFPQGSEKFLKYAIILADREFDLIMYRVLKEDETKEFIHVLKEKMTSNISCEICSIKPVLDYAPRKYVYRFHLRCKKQ